MPSVKTLGRYLPSQSRDQQKDLSIGTAQQRNATSHHKLGKSMKKQILECLISFTTGMAIALAFVLLFLAMPSCSDIFIERWDAYDQAQIDKIERYQREIEQQQKQVEQELRMTYHINKTHEKLDMRQNE